MILSQPNLLARPHCGQVRAHMCNLKRHERGAHIVFIQAYC